MKLTKINSVYSNHFFNDDFNSESMIAAFLNAPKDLQLKETPTPEPKAGEVRIKLSMIGVCGSDVHVYLGHRLLDKPTIIGHEGLGYIDKIGEGVTGRKVGERVVIEPNIPCRKCVYCYQGKGNICINKRVIGMNEAGCFAEYITLPEAFAWRVPEGISDADAVTIEPMAVGVHALLASKSKVGDTIAVVGLGAIGLLLTHLALSLGYKVLVTEINEKKLKMAENQGAIPVFTEGDADNQAKMLEAIWLENEVSSVFECAGSAFTASLVTAAAPRGSEIVLVGLSGNLATYRPLKIAREGITIVPSIIYDHPFDFKRTLQLIASKTIKPSFIISQYTPLADLETALQTAALGEESKIVITI
jgi:L-iditol 2-dehydrogenase